VLVLLDLADPMVKNGVEGLYAELAGARGYGEVISVFRRVVRGLQRAGLLVRRQRLEEGW
jgi:hypothetical protein